jgi:oxygen-independent coproporphyrinogen-3 oxidase
MNTSPLFDADLIRRYDIAGPRYTSYPTAPQFHSRFGESNYRAQVQASNSSGRDLSLYLHLPYCASPCFYCGCLRLITRDRAKIESYLEYLLREMELVAPLFSRGRRLTQLHLGGGTPNLLNDEQLSRLMSAIHRHFDVAADGDRQFGIEVDPRSTTQAAVHTMARLGFNRISLGVQDFDTNVQEAINRIQSVDETRAVIEAARASGFRSINCDLIYGLPRQRAESFDRTLQTVLQLRPDRIAAYSYAHLPHLFKAQLQISRNDLPTAADKLALLGRTVETLVGAGYRYIGMDHFALADDELSVAQENGTLHRNFQGYSTHADADLIALGLSSISQIGNSYSQNAKDLDAYRLAIDSGRLPIVRGLELSNDDRLHRDAIGRLMCDAQLDMDAFAREHGIAFRTYFAAALERLDPLIDDGLVTVDARCIQITPRGRLLMRVVAMCFDANLATDTAIRHSRAI